MSTTSGTTRKKSTYQRATRWTSGCRARLPRQPRRPSPVASASDVATTHSVVTKPARSAGACWRRTWTSKSIASAVAAPEPRLDPARHPAENHARQHVDQRGRRVQLDRLVGELADADRLPHELA